MEFVQAHIEELGLTVTHKAMTFGERNRFMRRLRSCEKLEQNDVVSAFLNETVLTLRDADGNDVWEKGAPKELDGQTVYDGGWVDAQPSDGNVMQVTLAILNPGEVAEDPLAASTGESATT